MKERKGCSGALLLLIVFILSAGAAYIYVPQFLIKEPKEESSLISSEESLPDDLPVIEWDNINTDDSWKKLSEYLTELEPVVAIKGMSDNLEWEDICREHFWVESFQVTGTLGSKIKKYSFEYKDDAADNRTMQKQIEKEINDIISVIPTNTDDWGKALALHDELIRRITYDKSDKEKHGHDIYGALVSHKAVCQGYTYSFTIISKRIGLKCEEIYSDTHIWTKLPGFDSGECYADVTWDDIDRCDSTGEPYIIHDNFGLSKEEIEKLKEHQPEKGSDSPVVRAGTGDNFFRKKGWFIRSGDTAKIEVVVTEQFESGCNIIEMRFEDENDLNGAKEIVEDILRSSGYNGSYLSWSNKQLYTYVVGLNPD